MSRRRRPQIGAQRSGPVLERTSNAMERMSAERRTERNGVCEDDMDLTSKQRAQLRGLANSIDTILIVGKDGIGDNLVKQANDALEARELIKGRVLENSLLSPREAAEELAPLTRSEIVQVIGTKFVLYRPSHKKDKKDKIILVSDRKR